MYWLQVENYNEIKPYKVFFKNPVYFHTAFHYHCYTKGPVPVKNYEKLQEKYIGEFTVGKIFMIKKL